MLRSDKHYFLRFIKEHEFLYFTYLVMLFLPFIAFVLCLFSVNSIMKQDTLHYQDSILQHEKTICDTMIHNTKIVVNTASLDANTKLLSTESLFLPESMLLAAKLSHSLSDYKRSYPYIESLGIYFRHNDSFVTDSKRYAPPLYGSYLSRYYLTIEDFLASTSAPSGYLLLTGADETYILIYQALFDYSLKKTTAVAYGILSWDALQRQLGYYKTTENGAFFLLNKDNVFFGCSDNLVSTDKLPDYETMYAQTGGQQTFFAKNKDTLISGIPSDELSFYYGMYLEKDAFYRAINLLLLKYIAGLSASILIGLFLAFYFTKKSTAPINHLLSIIEDSRKKNAGIALPQSYKKLEEALTTMLKDNRRLTHRVYLQEENLSETTLSNFLKGIYPNEDWILEYHDSHPALRGIKDYCILLFSFSNIETCKFIRGQKESQESYSLLFFSLKNVIDEAFIKKDESAACGISIVSDSMVICIIPAGDDASYLDSLVANVKNYIDFFQKVFELRSHAAVSARHALWTELPEAYSEAYILNSHISFWENECPVSVYHAETEDARPDGNSLLLLKKKLSNSLLANNYDMAKSLIDEIVAHYFLHDIRYFSYNQCQAYALISMLLDKLNDMGMNDDVKEEYSSRLLHAHSIVELKNEISAVFDELFDYQHQSSSDDAWTESVKQYIREHSANPDLSVSYVAEHFSVSAAHLGNRFRKLSGIGILDYIHMTRLSGCKDLLAQGYAIKDCVAMTGYTDIKTLQRAFKRYEGITPGQYKESVANQAAE